MLSRRSSEPCESWQGVVELRALGSQCFQICPVEVNDASPRRTLCQIALLRFGNSIRFFWIQGLPGVPELLQMGTPIKWERPFIVKLGMCNLPPDGGKLHRLFHSSMPKFSVTPIHRKTREVQFAAGGRQIAATFPLIVKRGRCNLPPEGGKLHRCFHSSFFSKLLPYWTP